MRRKDREMDEKFALEVIDKCAFSSVAMCDESVPYCVPLSPARVGRSLYFHSATDGLKSDILTKNPDVCVVCVGDVKPSENKFTTEYESAIVEGKAERVQSAEEKIIALRAICERYTPTNMAEFESAIERSLFRTDVWKISMDKITAKRKKYDADGKEMKFGRME